MLATDTTPLPTTPTGARTALLEEHPHTDRMRHIPEIDWLVAKLDQDMRQRIEKLWVPYSDLASNDPRHGPIETELRALARCLERIVEIAGRKRVSHPPSDLFTRLQSALSQAVSAISALDRTTFGKRLPFHTFERSNAEPLWATVLSSINHLQRVVPMVREVEPEIDERLYENLVQLREPMRRDPIA
jgi:hypothetical protein